MQSVRSHRLPEHFYPETSERNPALRKDSRGGEALHSCASSLGPNQLQTAPACLIPTPFPKLVLDHYYLLSIFLYVGSRFKLKYICFEKKIHIYSYSHFKCKNTITCPKRARTPQNKHHANMTTRLQAMLSGSPSGKQGQGRAGTEYLLKRGEVGVEASRSSGTTARPPPKRKVHLPLLRPRPANSETPASRIPKCGGSEPPRSRGGKLPQNPWRRLVNSFHVHP